MLKKISFNFKGKRANITAKNCTGISRSFGLMFKRKEKADALLFEFKEPVSFGIHSAFVFFPFLAVWLDGKNQVIGAATVKPFTFSARPEKAYNKILEIPLNGKYEKRFQNFFSRR